MTTGRINQVTTVLQDPRPAGGRAWRAPEERPWWFQKGWGDRDDRDHPPAPDSNRGDRGDGTGIQLPPLSFPRHGPSQRSGGESLRAAASASQEKGVPRPSRSENGYGRRPPFEWSGMSVRQRPTIHRLPRSLRHRAAGLRT